MKPTSKKASTNVYSSEELRLRVRTRILEDRRSYFTLQLFSRLPLETVARRFAEYDQRHGREFAEVRIARMELDKQEEIVRGLFVN